MMNELIKLKIDGKEIEAIEGRPLVEVARENGINIPTLCHFKDIYPPLSTCRICTCKINGRMDTACTTNVRNGMDVDVSSPEIADIRKAVVEMLFAEGNHNCPACTKSGNCDLQRRGYEMGLSISRFPHLFNRRPRDFSMERIFMEHNRCVLCKRCIELIKTDDGKNVFSFQNRGHKTLVGIDYELEKELSDEKIALARDICPVGAILVKGKTGAAPFGVRKFDLDQDLKFVPTQELKVSLPKDKKPVIATTSLAGCFGCHMSILDIDTELLDIIELVEFNKSPLTDIKKFNKQCDIGIIEGGIANNENIEVLKTFREKCDILIGLGECAIWGGLPAMRNTVSLEECLDEAYLHSVTSESGANIIPRSEDIPQLLDKVYSTNDIVKIDYFIPGCPPNADHIWKVVKSVLSGEQIPISYKEFKYD